MSKFILRIVSLVLVPCLIAEPSLANVRFNPQPSSIPVHAFCFQNEALALKLLAVTGEAKTKGVHLLSIYRNHGVRAFNLQYGFVRFGLSVIGLALAGVLGVESRRFSFLQYATWGSVGIVFALALTLGVSLSLLGSLRAKWIGQSPITFTAPEKPLRRFFRDHYLWMVILGWVIGDLLFPAPVVALTFAVLLGFFGAGMIANRLEIRAGEVYGSWHGYTWGDLLMRVSEWGFLGITVVWAIYTFISGFASVWGFVWGVIAGAAGLRTFGYTQNIINEYAVHIPSESAEPEPELSVPIVAQTQPVVANEVKVVEPQGTESSVILQNVMDQRTENMEELEMNRPTTVVQSVSTLASGWIEVMRRVYPKWERAGTQFWLKIQEPARHVSPDPSALEPVRLVPKTPLPKPVVPVSITAAPQPAPDELQTAERPARVVPEMKVIVEFDLRRSIQVIWTELKLMGRWVDAAFLAHPNWARAAVLFWSAIAVNMVTVFSSLLPHTSELGYAMVFTLAFGAALSIVAVGLWELTIERRSWRKWSTEFQESWAGRVLQDRVKRAIPVGLILVILIRDVIAQTWNGLSQVWFVDRWVTGSIVVPFVLLVGFSIAHLLLPLSLLRTYLTKIYAGLDRYAPLSEMVEFVERLSSDIRTPFSKISSLSIGNWSYRKNFNRLTWLILFGVTVVMLPIVAVGLMITLNVQGRDESYFSVLLHYWDTAIYSVIILVALGILLRGRSLIIGFLRGRPWKITAAAVIFGLMAFPQTLQAKTRLGTAA